MSEALFGGLLPTGDASEQALTRELELRRNAWDRPGYVFRGHGDLLLKHGKFFKGRELPTEWEHLVGVESACFNNSLAAALTNPALSYMEGVFSVGRKHFGLHAWVLDPEGRLLEVTMPTHDPGRFTDAETLTPYPPVELWSYWGVVVNAQYVQAHDEAFGLPMLDRPAGDLALHGQHGIDMMDFHDFPLLKVAYDRHRTQL